MNAPNTQSPMQFHGEDLQQMANAIRALSMDAVQQANSGHPGMPMGMADAVTVLFTRFLKFDPAQPAWPDRDRFVLSAGHGSMLLYSLLYLTGYEDMTLDQLRRFRQLGSRTPGHPEYGHAAGVEMTTGPLGQGLATATGMALAERMLNARYGDALVDHYTYVVAGDGCLMEGISHEAIDLAGHLGLAKLIVLFDDNGISIDGETSLTTSMDQLRRFEAAGWDTVQIDGHDPQAVEDAIGRARTTSRPSLIACRTTIGYGAPTMQGTASVHGSPLGEDEVTAAREQLGWTLPPFEIPASTLAAWRTIGDRGRDRRLRWEGRLADVPEALRQAFTQALAGTFGVEVADAIRATIQRFVEEQPKLATRKSSQQVLEALTAATPVLLGGSADLTGSNGTKTGQYRPVTGEDFDGTYIHYGVREHCMAAAMNGLALHGGFVPYGGTFLVFSDYARPAIRLAALMGQRVIHVMTHDSIGVGEDGPTHQPVEHLAALRAMPNVRVFRPADAVEVAEAWDCALAETAGPSVLCLTRQSLPALRTAPVAANQVGRGAYVLVDTRERRDITLLATGSEVSTAAEAAARLAASGINAAVVSMPCWELFRQQPLEYQTKVLGSAPRIAIEAAMRMGWDEWLGEDGIFLGMDSFGASAPGGELYEHFGITAAAIVAAAEERLAPRLTPASLAS